MGRGVLLPTVLCISSTAQASLCAARKIRPRPRLRGDCRFVVVIPEDADGSPLFQPPGLRTYRVSLGLLRISNNFGGEGGGCRLPPLLQMWGWPTTDIPSDRAFVNRLFYFF